jgi:hypothetical protein
LGGTTENIKALRIQKKVIRLITGIKKYESFRQKFKENRILTVTSMYNLEVMCFINKYISKTARSMNIIREANMTFTQSRNISLLQKCVLHMGVVLYKCLSLKIKKIR